MGLTASNWARGDPVMADACEAPVWREMGMGKGKGEWESVSRIESFYFLGMQSSFTNAKKILGRDVKQEREAKF